MQRKGQAAMEFLMTYGWAILAAIIVIGILGVYFFRSDILTPKGAVVNAPFYIDAWNADISGGGVSLDIKNNGGDSYTITSVGITDATVGGTARACNPDLSGGTISPGNIGTYTVDCSLVAADEGKILKGEIVIIYTKVGGTTSLQSTGTITEKIIA